MLATVDWSPDLLIYLFIFSPPASGFGRRRMRSVGILRGQLSSIAGRCDLRGTCALHKTQEATVTADWQILKVCTFSEWADETVGNGC